MSDDATPTAAQQRMLDAYLRHTASEFETRSVLLQLGLLDGEALPIVGAEAARQLLEPRGPLNQLIARARADTAEGDEA
jgi:hypothetical protein